MKFFIDNWILIAMALVSGGLLAWPRLGPLLSGAAGGGAVSTAEAVRLINREKGVLVDVSDAAEYAAGHAAGARNVPLALISGGSGSDVTKGLPTNKTLPLLLLCPNGARSAKAAALLRKAGYEKAAPVAGGTAGWRDASLPVEKSAEKPAEKTV